MLKGYIIEGVTGSGKTTYIKQIQSKLLIDYPENTKLMIGEAHTDRIFEQRRDTKKLIENDIINHFKKLLYSLEFFEDNLKSLEGINISEEEKKTFVVIERFILGYMTYMKMKDKKSWKGAYNKSFVKEIYFLCDRMNLKRIILYIPSKEIESRIESTANYRGIEWKRYIKSLGGMKKAVKFFKNWQDMFMSIVEEYEKNIKPTYVESKTNDLIQNWMF